jgi:hypothetical protein
MSPAKNYLQASDINNINQTCINTTHDVKVTPGNNDTVHFAQKDTPSIKYSTALHAPLI